MTGIMGVGSVYSMRKVGIIRLGERCAIGVLRRADWYNTHMA
jgi:hypothetical protein